MTASPGTVVAFAAGLVLAWGLGKVSRQFGAERRVSAVGLGVAALVYVGFAVAGRASGGWIGAEVAGLVIYGGLAVAGARGSARWLALGWALHPAWDVGLHLLGPGEAFVPAWYAWLCLSFDLVMARAAWRLSTSVESSGRASG